MGSVSVSSTVRFARVAIENFYQFSKPASFSSRRLSTTAVDSIQRTQLYSTVTEEHKSESNELKSHPIGLRENEKKLILDVDALKKDLQKYKEHAIELEDKYKRSLADSENLRVRLTKQIQDAKIFGIQEFCKDLVEIADILSKATESVPKNELTERNPHLKNLYEGLSITEAQLQKIFMKHRLVSINPIDEKFDPNQHEALFQQEVEGKAPGTVVVVSKVGYKLHERVIRPALVGVAKT